MDRDRKVLRELAARYLLIAFDGTNDEKRELQKAVNDRRMIRPVVLIDELPWHEMDIDGELTLRCEDSFLREVELFLRRTLFQHKRFRADMVVRPFVPVQKVIKHAGIGVEVSEHILEQGGGIQSHEYLDQLSTEGDLEKLHFDTVSYDEVETRRRADLVGDMVGDILPVKIVGIDHAKITTWDVISMRRGVTPLLLDLADRPEFMHRTAKKMSGILWDRMEQYARLGLFEADPYSLHCTSIASSDLKLPEDGSPRTLKDVWGRAAAQVFSSVGSSMHEEFDIEYMKDSVGRCGLVYYGCCEPLDRKIDIVEKIPNLRKISITPWADVSVAAERMGGRYVMAAKPNPAALATTRLDVEALKREITAILDACRRSGCHVELTLKDISTCCGNPGTVFSWERTVMDLVTNYQ